MLVPLNCLLSHLHEKKVEKLGSSPDQLAIPTVTHKLSARAITLIVCHIDQYSRDLGFDLR